MITFTHLESPLGTLLLTSLKDKLTGLYFTDQAHVPRIGPDWIEQENAEIFVQTRQELEEYAAEERESFDLSIDLHGTPFQRQVWQAIAAIPFGETVTYSELAQRVGKPKAVRAVGTAAGRNPVCWIIPCHRVVGKGGSLGGYAGGLPRKKALLEFEAGMSARSETILEFGKKEHGLALA